MAQIPGTGGPVSYPNRPEGGKVNGDNATVDNLPGGTARWTEPAPASPTAQMGAGVPGGGGLTPNPGEVATGTIRVGYKGSAYSPNGPDNLQPPANAGNEFETGAPNGPSVGVLGVPTSWGPTPSGPLSR